MVWEQPAQLEMIVQQESEARQALEAAREKAQLNDGFVDKEHHELIHKLEAEWEQARERLHRARGGAQTDG